MLDYFSAIPEGIVGTIAGGIVAAIVGGMATYVVLLRLQKRRERLKVILDLKAKHRSFFEPVAVVIVANFSSTPIWLQRLIFRAEEFGRFGKPVSLAVGCTIGTSREKEIECSKSIYEAFEQIYPGHKFYNGYVDITANVRSNGESAKPHIARRLTSHNSGVRDIEQTSRSKRFWERLGTRYLFWRLRR